EVTGGSVEHWSRHGSARVVDDDVDPAERFDRAIDERRHVVVVVHVDGGDNPSTSERVDLLRHRFELLDGTRGEHDVGASFGECQRAGAADASTGTGDDGGAAVDAVAIEQGHVAASCPWSRRVPARACSTTAWRT